LLAVVASQDRLFSAPANEDREQARKIIGLAMQQQQASLGPDRHPDFIGDFQSGAAFKIFFGDQNLNVSKKLGLIVCRKLGEEGHVLLNDSQPLVGKRPRLQPPPLSIFEESEHDLAESNAVVAAV